MRPLVAPALLLSGPALEESGDGPGPGGPSVGPDLFRSVLRQQATTVAVITAGTDQPVGFCATSVVSVSLDPPLVSFAVGLGSGSWPTLQVAEQVMVHLLGEGQEAIAQRFARSGGSKFGPPTDWHRGPYRLPRLDDVLAWLVLQTVHRLPIGDHALVVGRVIAAGHTGGRRPLVHHDGAFAQLADPAIG